MNKTSNTMILKVIQSILNDLALLQRHPRRRNAHPLALLNARSMPIPLKVTQPCTTHLDGSKGTESRRRNLPPLRRSCWVRDKQLQHVFTQAVTRLVEAALLMFVVATNEIYDFFPESIDTMVLVQKK